MKVIIASLLLITPWSVLLHSMEEKIYPTATITNPTQDKVLGVYKNGTVRLFDGTTHAVLRILKHPARDEPIITGAFNETGERVAAGSRGAVWIWDVATGNLLRTIRVDEGLIASVEFNGDRVILGLRGHSVQIWDITTGNRIQ